MAARAAHRNGEPVEAVVMWSPTGLRIEAGVNLDDDRIVGLWIQETADSEPRVYSLTLWVPETRSRGHAACAPVW